MTKKKETSPQEQPVAAPAAATEQEAAQQDQAPAQEQPTPDENPSPQEQPVAAHPLADQIEQCKGALRSFLTLPEGYVNKAGIFFDKEIAEQKLEDGEELIIVTRL